MSCNTFGVPIPELSGCLQLSLAEPLNINEWTWVFLQQSLDCLQPLLPSLFTCSGCNFKVEMPSTREKPSAIYISESIKHTCNMLHGCGCCRLIKVEFLREQAVRSTDRQMEGTTERRGDRCPRYYTKAYYVALSQQLCLSTSISTLTSFFHSY